MTEPERPIEPKEPEVFDVCVLCGGEIYKGERCYVSQNGRVCCFCAERLTLMDEIAGEDL